MLGIILWFNAAKHVGLVWCEDQGPLAFIGPDADIPSSLGQLERGAQIWFDLDDNNGFRTVVRIADIPVVMSGIDPVEVLAKFDKPSLRPMLRVVA